MYYIERLSPGSDPGEDCDTELEAIALAQTISLTDEQPWGVWDTDTDTVVAIVYAGAVFVSQAVEL